MRLLADAILILHASFVAFVVFGLLAIWIGIWRHWAWARARWFRIAHLSAIALVALETLIGIACPLTILEDWLREDRTPQSGFIAHWLHLVLYWDFPAWVFTAAYLVFALLVLITFMLFPPKPRRPR